MHSHWLSITRRITVIGFLLVLILGAPALVTHAALGLDSPAHQSALLPSGTIIYVDRDASGPANDGLSWTNAYTNLQAALSVAVSTDEIWVAAGTYTPTTPITRTATFQLKAGVAIYGGFAATETLRTQRNWATNVVTLSGDLNGDDGPNFANNDENSYHVVTGATGATLDGVTISGGNANGPSSFPCDIQCGGGMYNDSNSPALAHVIFSGNSAASAGGGMYNLGESGASSPALTYVTFISNSAAYGGGLVNNGDVHTSSPTLTYVTFISNSAMHGNGGGLANFGDGGESSPTMTHVTFQGNTASVLGGGLINSSMGAASSPTLINVAFISNTAAAGGGLVNISEGGPTSPALTNVTFQGNTAGVGGGLANVNYSSGVTNTPTLTNATFSHNSASNAGGGLANQGISGLILTNVTFNGNSAPDGGGLYNYMSNVQVRNSILWDNGGGEITNVTSTFTITTSIVQGGYVSGTNILDTDPRLGPLGDYGGGTTTIPLLPGSPAINGADTNCPVADQRGVLRGATCDIGAFESRGFSLTKAGGDNQTTLINIIFANPLVISVTSAYSEPVNGGRVILTAPTSGASISGTSPITLTIASGAVSQSVTANGTVGSYNVAASVGGATSVMFALTNTARVYLPLIVKNFGAASSLISNEVNRP